MAYAFEDGSVPDRRETQYFEVACNRGIYHKGWSAVTRHSIPWVFGGELPALDDDVWELYDTTTDWSQAHDLAAEHPDKLKDLQRLWLIEAVKYNVLPLDDRRIERFNSDIAGRPVLVKGNAQLLYEGMTRLSENSVLNMKNKSHSVTAEVEVPKGGASGVIIAQGGAFAGWSLYLHEGKPKYCHNLAGLMRFYVESTKKVPAGKHQVRMEFAYDGGGLAKGGTSTLFIDGKKVGEGRINATVPMIYSGDETCDLGVDTGTPVSEDYTSESSHFTGRVKWVELQIGDDSHDHLISAEELMRVATAIQ
jgi:arylsulfatase